MTQGRSTMFQCAGLFKHYLSYLLRMLQARGMKIGGDSEVDYLVMRINFNEWHIKESR